MPVEDCSKMTEETNMHMEHAMHKMDKESHQTVEETDCCNSDGSCSMQHCFINMPAFISQLESLSIKPVHISDKYFYDQGYLSRVFDSLYRPPIFS